MEEYVYRVWYHRLYADLAVFVPGVGGTVGGPDEGRFAGTTVDDAQPWGLADSVDGGLALAGVKRTAASQVLPTHDHRISDLDYRAYVTDSADQALAHPPDPGFLTWYARWLDAALHGERSWWS